MPNSIKTQDLDYVSHTASGWGSV